MRPLPKLSFIRRPGLSLKRDSTSLRASVTDWELHTLGDFDEYRLTDLLDLLISQLDADTLRDTQRAITAWLTEALRIKGANFPNRSIDSLLEFRTMLEENIDRWLQRRHDAGEALGALKTTRAHLSKLITIKFGPREGRDAELEARSLETLELALERILLVDSEDALWT